jgi:hypothetical protein
MFKIGLEKEFFCLNEENEVCLVPANLPKDDCGWLVEARGDPFKDIIEAIFSLKASCYRIEQAMADYNARLRHPENSILHISDAPLMRVYRETRIEAQRRNEKGRIKYNNLYGHKSHRHTLAEATAGLHIHFSNEKKYYSGPDKSERTYNANFDWPFIFTTLDREFADEIKAAKRHPGFYEIKQDGRVEYRSLPSNANLDKLIDVLNKVLTSKDLIVP